MSCIIKYKNFSIDENSFVSYLNKIISINNLFEENRQFSSGIYEALGFVGNINNLKVQDMKTKIADKFDDAEKIKSDLIDYINNYELSLESVKEDSAYKNTLEQIKEWKKAKVLNVVNQIAKGYVPSIDVIEYKRSNDGKIFTYTTKKGDGKNYIENEIKKLLDWKQKLENEKFTNLTKKEKEYLIFIVNNLFDVNPATNPLLSDFYTSFEKKDKDKLWESLKYNFENITEEEIDNLRIKGNILDTIFSQHASFIIGNKEGKSGLPDNLAELELSQITPQQKQQAQQLYAQYLDTIFPDSKVKDIVYRGGEKEDNRLFQYWTNNKAEAYMYAKAHITKGGNITERNPIPVIKDNIAKRYNLSKNVLWAITDTQLGIDGLQFEDLISEEEADKARELLSTNKDIKNLNRLIELYSIVKIESEEDLMKQFDDTEYQKYKPEYDKIKKELEPFFNRENIGKISTAIINITNPYKEEIVQEDLQNNRDAYKNGHDGAFLMYGDHFLVKNNTNQIQELGSKQDIEGFKEFVKENSKQGDKQQNLNIKQSQQLYSQYLESLNKPNTNPILKGNQQEQVKKFAELQERLNNKEFLEGAKNAYESSEELQNVYYEALGFKQELTFIKSDNTIDDDFYIKDILIVTKELQNIRTNNFDGSINRELSELKAKLNTLPIGSKFNVSEYTNPTSTNLEEVLSRINLSESNKILLEKIRPLIKDVKIEYVNKFILADSGAVYSDKYNTIRINKSEKNIPLEELLMHELLHAATFRKITYFETNTKGLSKKELEALNELENIRKVLKEASDKYWDNRPRFARSVNPLEGYRTDSIHEIISYAFTNKEFRDAISEIPYKGDKSILDKLIELISNIFKVKQNTILQNLIANAEVLLETKDNLREEIITSLLADNSEIQYSKRESNSNTIDRHASSYFTKNNAFFIDHVTSEAMFDNIKSYLSFHYPGIKTYDDYRNYIFELNDKDTILNFINFVTKC